MTKNIKEGRPKVSLVLSKQRKRQQNQTSQKKLFWSFEKKKTEREKFMDYAAVERVMGPIRSSSLLSWVRLDQ